MYLPGFISVRFSLPAIVYGCTDLPPLEREYSKDIIYHTIGKLLFIIFHDWLQSQKIYHKIDFVMNN